MEELLPIDKNWSDNESKRWTDDNMINFHLFIFRHPDQTLTVNKYLEEFEVNLRITESIRLENKPVEAYDIICGNRFWYLHGDIYYEIEIGGYVNPDSMFVKIPDNNKVRSTTTDLSYGHMKITPADLKWIYPRTWKGKIVYYDKD